MQNSVLYKMLIENNASIGEYCVLGRDGHYNDLPTHIGKNGEIGSYVIIENNIQIGDNFSIDDYCAIYSGAKIGNNLILCYGKKIYSNSIVGDDCIIGGNICERMVLGDRVTFMGEVAHSHYDPTQDWNTTDEPSPMIGTGSVIGVNAIIVGGITVGENCYVSAGEILRSNLPDNSVFIKNKIYSISSFKGLIKTRY